MEIIFNNFGKRLGWGGIREDVPFAGNLDIYEFKILDETCIGSKKSRMCVSIES